jgi:nitroreductase
LIRRLFNIIKYILFNQAGIILTEIIFWELIYMDILKVIKERKSIRAFRPDTVPLDVIEMVISQALNAPSAINLQPWEFYVVYGEEKVRLSRLLMKSYNEKKISCGPGTKKPLPASLSDRGKRATEEMQPYLKELGIPFDKFVNEGSCDFYGAPVAILIFIDDCFPKSRFLDIGIVLAYLLLIAQDYNLSTCPVGLLAAYENEIKDFLNIADNKLLAISLAVGYADTNNPINQYKSSRESSDKFIKWVG